MGHEPMGVVVDVGSEVRSLREGDRVVIPFVIACGACYMCTRGLTTQCETTQNRDQRTGATLYGYTELYGQVPGGQAEFLRVPLADCQRDEDQHRSAGRALPVPERHPAHRMAGRRVRGGPGGRHAPRHRTRPGRAVRRPHRHVPRVPGDRGRPGSRAACARRAIRGRDARHRRRTSSSRCSISPTGGARTPSSTPSAWRRTATRSRPSRRAPSACCRAPPPRSSRRRSVSTASPP